MSKSILYLLVLCVWISTNTMSYAVSKHDSLRYSTILKSLDSARYNLVIKNYDDVSLHTKIATQDLQTIHSIDTFYWITKRNILSIQHESAVSQRDFKTGYELQQQLTNANDSLFAYKKKYRTQDLYSQHELVQVKSDQEYFQTQYEVSQVALKKTTYSLLALALSVLTVGGIIFIIFSSNKKRERNKKRLANMITARTDELGEIKAELQSTNKELEKLAYISSSDFKKPLTNIRNNINSIADTKEELPEDVKTYLAFVTDSSERLEHLIDDLFSFTQLKDKDLVLKDCKLNNIVEESKQHIASLLMKKNAKVSYYNLPTIHTYRSQVGVIMKNLIENGIKYNTNKNPEVHVQYTLYDDKHLIQILDNGIGIAPEFQADVFKQFKRLHSKEEYDGTGLGLAICQKIAHTLGGKITLRSTLGKGSIFTLELPANI